MISAEELAGIRQRAEHPEQPLKGDLAVTNCDTYCDWCRGQGKDEEACSLEVTDAGTWVVAGSDGTYHVDCAKALGWVPSLSQNWYLRSYPDGPYA